MGEPEPTGPRVWVKVNGAYQPESLEIGYSDSDFTEILGGELEAGDEVLVGYQN